MTDLSSENSTFNISVDGGDSISVTFTARDYSGLTMNDLMTDLQTAINNALTADGQAASVTVSTNSPLQITSNNTGATSAIAISSLSGPLQAALGTIETEQRIEFGDTVYYAVGSGYITTTPSGSFTPSNPTPPTPPSPTPPTCLARRVFRVARLASSPAAQTVVQEMQLVYHHILDLFLWQHRKTLQKL